MTLTFVQFMAIAFIFAIYGFVIWAYCAREHRRLTMEPSEKSRLPRTATGSGRAAYYAEDVEYVIAELESETAALKRENERLKRYDKWVEEWLSIRGKVEILPHNTGDEKELIGIYLDALLADE